MKNAKIRHVLESEILRLRAHKKPLSKGEFERYCKCLKRLYTLEQKSAIKQKEIYTCAYGSMADFVDEFVRQISPLIRRKGKVIKFNTVRSSRTYTLFSPRLTEIALGSMMLEFFCSGSTINLSVFGTKSGVVVCIEGKVFKNCEHALNCVRHIAKLHGGRCIVSFCKAEKRIILSFPFFPSFQPLKLVPCSTELCRLCHI